MNSSDPSPQNAPNLSSLGRELFDTGGRKQAGPWVPPTAEELARLLPGYEVTQMLGRGGMGAVYMGRQKSLDRPVAIKILSSTLEETDAGFAERFKNEAKAMAKLNHPGIVSVYDFGETEGGLLYIVMEYVDGTDVARMIATNGRLHTEHAMAITAHVCDALAYAHERGIIHRDIKPANIMVGFDGVVKVADFGLAKVHSDSGTAGLTQSGMAMGTLHFMAPEMFILGSGNVDQRADVYAVGVMLYQMLTGKVPHGMFELPSLQVAGLDPRYDDIIAKAMREDRNRRYQSTSEMRADLDAIMTQPVAKVTPTAPKGAIPAALPTQARPQRPGGQPYRPPAPARAQAVLPAKRKPAPLLWVALMTMGATSAWLYFSKPVADGSKQSSATRAPENPPIPTTPTPAPLGEPSNSTTNPTAATKDRPFVNSLGMKFVPVPITGGPTSGTRVLFSVWETRVQDYQTFVEDTNRAWKKPDFKQSPDHPAVHISWYDANEFCAWMTKRERQGAMGGAIAAYRLPSDHEWSCAVGVGDSEDASLAPAAKHQVLQDFPWGTQWPPPMGAGNFGVFKSEGRTDGKTPDTFPFTSPAGTFEPNRFGLYDIGGNVTEWCQDLVEPGQENRVVRGLGFPDTNRQYLLSSNRGGPLSSQALNSNGFRVVLESMDPAPTASAKVAPTALDAQLTIPKPDSTPSLPADVTTWIDTKGRTLTAIFVQIVGSNVILDVAGKQQPVKLDTLSEASRKLALRLQEQLPKTAPSPALKSAFTKTKPMINSLGMKLVPLPGANVLICIHETRNADYAVYSEANPMEDSQRRANRFAANDTEPGQPVAYVTWQSAKDFCTWLSGKEKRNYRLPTDREWSLAVGISGVEDPAKSPAELSTLAVEQYPWGNQWPPPSEFGNFADTAASYRNPRDTIPGYTDGHRYAAPVMSYTPNDLGIFDLSGNVTEACEDWMDSSHSKRVWRGGAYGEFERLKLRSAHRFGESLGHASPHHGFRIVVELPVR